MKIVVTGATGFIGKALCNELAAGHSVVALTRDPAKASGLFDPAVQVAAWNPHRADGWEKCLEGCDAVVNLAGTNVASGLWTPRKKAQILNSRVKASTVLIETIGHLQNRPTTIVTASAIGFYGNRGDEALNEQSPPGQGFLAQVSQTVEKYSAEFETIGIRSVVIRTGIVLGTDGGALPKMMLPFKFYLGGYWGRGDQWMSWISLADEIAAIKFLIERQDLQGAFNLTAPQPIQNRQFFQTVAKSMRKPCWHLPAFILKMALGQMAEEMFLSSQRVYPTRLIEAGFTFQYPTIEQVL